MEKKKINRNEKCLNITVNGFEVTVVTTGGITKEAEENIAKFMNDVKRGKIKRKDMPF